MFVDYLLRGMKAGLVTGVVFGLFVALVANPLVGFADELGHGEHHDEAASDGHEADGHHAGGDTHESALSVASAVSVASSVLWAVLLGAVVFGVAYYFLEPVLPGTGHTKSYVLGAAGFLTVSGAPWLVLPPQPPGVEQAVPVGTRLLLYGGMMVAGAGTCLLAVLVYDRLHEERGRAVAASLALTPTSMLVVPAVIVPTTTVESALPTELAAGLTGLVVFGQLLVWLLLAAVHARLQAHATDTPRVDVSTQHLPTAD